MNILEVENFSVKHGENFVLQDLSFAVEAGEFVAILGKSGSGKTTLLHALAGLIPSVGLRKVPDSLNMVFQQYGVFPWYTVEQNILLGAKKSEQNLEHFLQMTGLEKHRNHYPHELSGGQVQRVAIARAFASNPQVLFMDEPFGALDAHTRSSMQEWLLRIWQHDRKTVLFVTHSIEEAIFLADRVVVMKEGRLVEDRKILFPRPRHEDLKFSSEFNNLKRYFLGLMSL